MLTSLTNMLLQVEAVAAPPTIEPAFVGLSSLELLLLALMVLVFLAGAGTIFNLSLSFGQMRRMELLRQHHPERVPQTDDFAAADVGEPWWKQLYDRLTDDVPIEEEQAIVLDHEYDGIHELDNNLPPWWKGVFYISIAFAPIYLWFNHFSDFGNTSREAYAIEMEVAKDEVRAYLATQENAVDESSVTLLMDREAITRGQSMFLAKCAVCHGQLGEGGIGPNLTDEYWIHGGDIADIFTTIKYGVPEKGMIAWKSEMRPRDMQEVASFIKSLGGTEPDNAKEPQGEFYDEEEEELSK